MYPAEGGDAEQEDDLLSCLRVRIREHEASVKNK